jgi:hypothetical protein
MAEKQRPLTKSNGLQSHTSENACSIFPPHVVLTDVKDPTITLWRSVKRVMCNCLSPGSCNGYLGYPFAKLITWSFTCTGYLAHPFAKSPTLPSPLLYLHVT